MPLPPPAQTFICRFCVWQRTLRPRSDALQEGRDFVTVCPSCGKGPMQRRDATAVERRWAQLVGVFGK